MCDHKPFMYSFVIILWAIFHLHVHEKRIYVDEF